MEVLLKGYLDQLRRGLELGKDLVVKPPVKDIRNVVIAGMGASGTAASIVQSVTADRIQIPVVLIQSYDLPAFVNEHTLFIASSFSGTTEEVISTLTQAIDRNATIACLTTGGKLLEIAQQNGLTITKIPFTEPHSKACIGYSVIQLLFLLKQYSLISDWFIPQIEAAIELIDEREYFIDDGAKNVAEFLKGKLPVIYGDEKFGPVLHWLQQQINTIGKQFAHTNLIPELNHNEIEGWVHPATLLENTMIVMLTTTLDHPRIQLRIDETRQIIYKHSAGIIEVILLYGNSLLEQMLYAINLFDWISFYLAKENNVDPLVLKNISELKDHMSKQ
ncbi:bifunctional phosphoglucose/phosphomannose isomerase [Cytophagaceae bacterium DM2B3-1]|uniref:Bifunctional phosphoglucose/phosphomannose isomerase n=1 Tax=Xanthocytophaga flava TaxID=3048013 RepID=A0ABT7CE39_9BACT|nr:bifunctional phosphoglucose/phosphomannose isomerase [Xanthocytophaga flavus]MDJ1491971.1 bifunctional phosphoglucose/phosphomannose isomerase [Xanthocytophaga flavus]